MRTRLTFSLKTGFEMVIDPKGSRTAEDIVAGLNDGTFEVCRARGAIVTQDDHLVADIRHWTESDQEPTYREFQVADTLQNT